MRFFLILFLVGLTSCGVQKAQSIHTLENRFTGQTTKVFQAILPSSGHAEFLFSAEQVTGSNDCKYGDIVAGFTFRFDHWRYLRVQSINVLIDGKSKNPLRMTLPVTHTGDVGHNSFGVYVDESLAFIAPDSIMRSFLNSSTIEFQVGKDEYNLSTSQLSELNEFGRKLCLTPERSLNVK